MNNLATPHWLGQHLFKYKPEQIDPKVISRIASGLQKFKSNIPKVSIVIPAYNEEAAILNTLSSFAEMKMPCATELIVANNNSKDATAQILEKCGVKTVSVADQGISYARQGGMEAAKGAIILSADADTLYPPEWILAYLEAFKNPKVVCAYGSYAFIPGEYASRLSLALYEKLSQMKFKMRKGRAECKNVMGFNFAYRKESAMKIGGFKHDLNRAETGRSEDGWMAWELYPEGKLVKTDARSLVWTDTRRLQEDGSIFNAFAKRISAVLK